MRKLTIPMNTVPLNRFKEFEVELELGVFEGLRLLYETCPLGRDINKTAEAIFNDWVCSHLPGQGEKNRLLWRRAREMGYVPVKSGRRRQNSDTFGIVYVALGDMPRYVVEQLPRAEPTSTLRNPYYQYSPEQMIAAILKEEVPRYIEEFKQGGLFDEDDVSW